MNDQDNRIIPFPAPSRRPTARRNRPAAPGPQPLGLAGPVERPLLRGPGTYSVTALLPPPTGRFPTPAELMRLMRETMEGRKPDPETERFIHSNEVLLDWLYYEAELRDICTAGALARALGLPDDFIVLLQEERLLVRDINPHTARVLAAFLGLPGLVVQVAAGQVTLQDFTAVRRRSGATRMSAD